MHIYIDIYVTFAINVSMHLFYICICISIYLLQTYVSQRLIVFE